MNRNIWIGSGVAINDDITQLLSPFVDIKPLDNAQLNDLSIQFSGIIVEHDHTIAALPSWLPTAKVSQLNNPVFLHHFLLRVIILNELNALIKEDLSRGAVIAFHSRYKLLLLAHSQPLYRELGPFVAAIATRSIQEFMIEYRQRIMALLAIPSTPENHANVLSHIQGYFRLQLEAKKRQELANLIQDYLNQKVTLDEPINLIRHYMQQYPHPYLEQQAYFEFYPKIIHRKQG